MSDVVDERPVEAVVDVVELEDRRAKRDLKHWMVKTITLFLMAAFLAIILSLVYAAVIQEKDLDTSFIGEMFKALIDFLRFLM
jgi:Na+/H+-dicarboxylate symporter